MLATCFHADLLLCLFFDPEDGGDMFLRNNSWLSTDYRALYPRRQYSSSTMIISRITVGGGRGGGASPAFKFVMLMENIFSFLFIMKYPIREIYPWSTVQDLCYGVLGIKPQFSFANL
jgi:hypothetical protein